MKYSLRIKIIAAGVVALIATVAIQFSTPPSSGAVEASGWSGLPLEADERQGDLPSGAFAPLTPYVSADVAKVELGRDLFHEPLLSHDNTISCSSCHDLARGGVDGRRFGVGINGAIGDVNVPSVLNSALNFSQFWDGRALTLTEQAEGPLKHPKEMGSTWEEIIEKLQSSPKYAKKFSRVYKNGIQHENVVDAIVEFERTLITVDSKFDLYLKGDAAALDQAQISGFRKFSSYGCVACHQGRNVGGNMYQALGVTGDYFKDRGGFLPSDLGRYNLTKNEQDKHVFRVPSLRNVELTGPYFHDGSVATLDEAVRKMAKYQLGRTLPDTDVAEIVAFLKTLTGKLPGSVKGRGVANED